MLAWSRHWERLHREVQVLGPWLFLLPAFTASIFASAIIMMIAKQAPQRDIGSMALVGIEGGIPLAAGIALAAITAQEPALETQLTLPTPYRRLLSYRLALLLVWSALIEIIGVVLLTATAPWVLNAPAILTWLAPLLWFGGVGTVLVLVLRNRSASAALLGVIWVIELAFHNMFAGSVWTRSVYIFATMFDATASFWLTNRLELLATALACFIAAWLYLGSSERRFQSIEE